MEGEHDAAFESMTQTSSLLFSILIFYCTEGEEIGRCKSVFTLRHEGTLYYYKRQWLERNN
jgi:hypothetical protein